MANRRRFQLKPDGVSRMVVGRRTLECAGRCGPFRASSKEEWMRAKSFLLILAVILFPTEAHLLRGQTPASTALSGQVSSKEEGPMEGVLVSAKKAGWTVTITVVTDQQGRYS